MERYYCTLAELIGDLELEGVKAFNEGALLSRIEAASEWIDREFGNFIPIVETRTVDGSGEVDLFVKPLLALTSLVMDGQAIQTSDVLLYPEGRYWEHGPYTRMRANPDSNAFHLWTTKKQGVTIGGWWGLYERSVQLSAVSSQLVGDDTLAVSNGASISPGMVMLIGDEQELVTGYGEASDSTANLNGAVDGAQETITLDNASLVNTGETIRVDFEQMKVQDKAGNVLLVRRGWNGTAKASHLSGADVAVFRTFLVMRGVNGTTASAHDGAAIGRYVPPADVNWLCRQMAGLMHKKAASGFAGKTGNAELGETFYHNEFPAQIREIRRHYWVAT